jgi:hypothetical protein
MILNQLIEILDKAQNVDGSERTNKIKEFQEIVWDDETIQDETLNDILSTLAYDFDYYEPDKKMRDEDSSYYGDERLLEEIKKGLEKLRKY